MQIRYPGESSEFRSARDHLLELEVAHRRAAEAAAKARRELPPGPLVTTDYVFEKADFEGKPIPVKLSELFTRGQKTLAIYSYMLGPERKLPCNMCTPLMDAIDGVEEHIRQRMNFVVVAQSPVTRLEAWKKARGWKRLRMLSAAGNTYNHDFFGKTPDKQQDMTMLTVLKKEGNDIRLFWSSELDYGPQDPGQDHRGLDAINPVFAMLDFTPEGRGDFYPRINYDE